MITQNKPDREEVINALKQFPEMLEYDRENDKGLSDAESRSLQATISSALSLLTRQREDEKDRARLDWLEKQEDIKLSDAILRPPYEGATWEMGFVIERPGKDDACGNRLRECIDSAMASTSTADKESV
jgi:hypothetical protein